AHVPSQPTPPAAAGDDADTASPANGPRTEPGTANTDAAPALPPETPPADLDLDLAGTGTGAGTGAGAGSAGHAVAETNRHTAEETAHLIDPDPDFDPDFDLDSGDPAEWAPPAATYLTGISFMGADEVSLGTGSGADTDGDCDALDASPFSAGLAGAPTSGGQGADGPSVWPPQPAAPSTTGDDHMDDRTGPSPSASNTPGTTGTTDTSPGTGGTPPPWVPRPSGSAHDPGTRSDVITFVIRGDAEPRPDEGTAAVAQGAPATREVTRRRGFTLAGDGSYAACMAEAEGGWFVERWTMGDAEPYAVPLPGAQPEDTGTEVAPLPDGRVLVLRRVGDRYDAVLLYPAGPGTGELRAGSVSGEEVRLLPPSPVPGTAFVLAWGEGVSTVWQVLGTGDGSPAPVMTVRGRCTGGVWLDRTGRLLALDREVDGRAKAVAADLHTGAVSPLLQLTEDSDDRLVLAEPDSGLLLLRSDAAGGTRLGWGVLGSTRPVRFPDVLRVPGIQLSPVAAQPGQSLSPESVVVALRAEAPGGAEALALWRPGERRVHWRAVPAGWLSGAGLWLPRSDLHLPFATPEPGLMRYDLPPTEPEERVERAARARAGLTDEAEDEAEGDDAHDAHDATRTTATGPSGAPPAHPVHTADPASPAAAPDLASGGVPAVAEPRVVREPGRPKP
ncbi:hypothetical protein, partial [Actinacidiphila rubida]